MKKTFFILSLTAVLLASCGGNQPKKPTSLSMSWEELTLAPEESVRLYCKTEPSNPDARPVWSSSDPAVATVDQIGYVTAVAPGRTVITAKLDELTATCAVTVASSYLSTLSFTGAGMMEEPDTTFFDGKVHQAKMGGNDVYVYLSMAHFLILSDGLYINEDGKLDGSVVQGAVISVDIPMYYGPRELNGGKSVGSIFNNNYIIDGSKPLNEVGYAQPGQIDKERYINAISEYCNASNNKDQNAMFVALDSAVAAVTGATLYTAVYHSREEGYPVDGFVVNSLPDALVTEGHFKFNNKGVNALTYGLPEFDVTIRPLDKSPEHYYGTSLTFDPDKGYYLVDRELHMLPDVHLHK